MGVVKRQQWSRRNHTSSSFDTICSVASKRERG